MKKQMTTNELLSSMSVSQAITKLAFPGIISMVIMGLYNVVDTIFIGMLNSDEALGAVGVAFPIMTLMSAVGQIIGAGSAATIGRAFGYKDDDYASKTATTMIYTSFVAGFIFMVIGLSFLEPIFKLFGATDTIMPYAIEYGGWMFVGAMFSIPNQTFNNISRAETKALLSMASLLTGSIANVILDPIFMFDSFWIFDFGLGLGIEGASIATTISQALSFVFVSQFYFRGKSRVVVKPRNFKPSVVLYSEVFRSGAPIAVTQLLSTFAVSATNLVAVNMSSYGDTMVAAYGVVLKVISMVQFSVLGFLQGYQPIASFAYGAKDKKRFDDAFRFTTKVVMSIAFVVTILVQVFADDLIIMFSESTQIVEIGTTFLTLNNVFFVFTAFSYLMMLTFQATGNGKHGSILAFSRQGFLYIPFLLILPIFLGDLGIFISQPLADIFTGIIALFLFKHLKVMLNNHFSTK